MYFKNENKSCNKNISNKKECNLLKNKRFSNFNDTKKKKWNVRYGHFLHRIVLHVKWRPLCLFKFSWLWLWRLTSLWLKQANQLSDQSKQGKINRNASSDFTLQTHVGVHYLDVSANSLNHPTITHHPSLSFFVFFFGGRSIMHLSRFSGSTLHPPS